MSTRLTFQNKAAAKMALENYVPESVAQVKEVAGKLGENKNPIGHTFIIVGDHKNNLPLTLHDDLTWN